MKFNLLDSQQAVPILVYNKKSVSVILTKCKSSHACFISVRCVFVSLLVSSTRELWLTFLILLACHEALKVYWGLCAGCYPVWFIVGTPSQPVAIRLEFIGSCCGFLHLSNKPYKARHGLGLLLRIGDERY